MGEFDLDPQLESAAGFGWEAHFRLPGGPAAMNIRGANCGDQTIIYPTDPTWASHCSCPDVTCGATCAETCGASGRPCIC